MAENDENKKEGAPQGDTPPGGVEGDQTKKAEEAVQKAEFSHLAVKESTLGGIDLNSPTYKENIKLLLDVPMEVTVEMGRAKKTIEQILTLGEGSVIELDKLAGEPINLLVNGKIIAKGEVVVIDEYFGLRITSIIGPEQRIIDTDIL